MRSTFCLSSYCLSILGSLLVFLRPVPAEIENGLVVAPERKLHFSYPEVPHLPNEIELPRALHSHMTKKADGHFASPYVFPCPTSAERGKSGAHLGLCTISWYILCFASSSSVSGTTN